MRVEVVFEVGSLEGEHLARIQQLHLSWAAAAAALVVVPVALVVLAA